MEHQAVGYTYSADFLHIERALKGHWPGFTELVSDLRGFKPKVESDFAEAKANQLEHLRRLNPDKPESGLVELVNSMFGLASKPAFQVSDAFTNRFMSLYVSVALLSHALCEAAINAILALGLAESNAHDLFALLERAELKEKWCNGPKAFHPAYHFPKGRHQYQTLQRLVSRRNAFVHYKIELKRGESVLLAGVKLERETFDDLVHWLERFFNLPYDLVEHARRQLPRPPLLLFERAPIGKLRGAGET